MLITAGSILCNVSETCLELYRVLTSDFAFQERQKVKELIT